MADNPEPPGPPFEGEPTDTREQIMQAAFETVTEHGFVGLSIGRIAERADISKSSVYHFYDDKNDLLLAFLDSMLAQFGDPLEAVGPDDPEEALWAYVDFGLSGVGSQHVPPVDDVDEVSGRSYVELRSQATHDTQYRARFTDIDASMRDRLAAVIERGIDDGVFRPVDADQTAELLLTVLLGGMFRRATSDGVDTAAIRTELDAVLERFLRAESKDS